MTTSWYLRLFWETPVESGFDWRGYQKGGEYSQYYSDVHLVADWDAQRRTFRGDHGRPGRPSELPQNYQYYFMFGITWSRRSQRGLSMRILPSGCVFSDKGPVILWEPDRLWILLAVANSLAFRGLVDLSMTFGLYEVGVIQGTPVPDISGEPGTRMGGLARSSFDLKRSFDASQETTHAFQLPALLRVAGETLGERIAECRAQVADTLRRLAENQSQIDDIAFLLYGIDIEDRRSLVAGHCAQTETADEHEEVDEGAGANVWRLNRGVHPHRRHATLRDRLHARPLGRSCRNRRA